MREDFVDIKPEHLDSTNLGEGAFQDLEKSSDLSQCESAFVSAFEVTQVLFSEKETGKFRHHQKRKQKYLCYLKASPESSLFEDHDLQFSTEVEDARALFGHKVDVSLAFHQLPTPTTAFVHPEIAVEYFSRLRQHGIWRSPSTHSAAENLAHTSEEQQTFLSKAAAIFQELVEECCKAEVYLPMFMQYQSQADKSLPPPLIMRSSVTKPLANFTQKPLAPLALHSQTFPSITITSSQDVPRAIAQLSWFYLQKIQEMQDRHLDLADAYLYPGNFALQSCVTFLQKGELLFFAAKTLATCHWELRLERAPESLASPFALPEQKDVLDKQNFSGVGFKKLQAFLPKVLTLLPTLRALPCGVMARFRWGICEHTQQLLVLGVKLLPHPNPYEFRPITYEQSQARQLRPLYASRFAAYLPHGASWYGWVIQNVRYRKISAVKFAELVLPTCRKLLGAYLSYKIACFLLNKPMQHSINFVESCLAPSNGLAHSSNLGLSQIQAFLAEAEGSYQNWHRLKILIARAFEVQEQYASPTLNYGSDQEPTWDKIQKTLQEGQGNSLHAVCSTLASLLESCQNQIQNMEKQRIQFASEITGLSIKELEFLTPQEIDKLLFLKQNYLENAKTWRQELDYRISRRMGLYQATACFAIPSSHCGVN